MKIFKSSPVLTNTRNKNKSNFPLLVFGRAVSGIGSAVFSFGLSLYVLDLTGSAAVFSLIFSLSIIPGVLVNLFASIFVDRWNKKRIMVITDIISGLIVFVFLLIFNIYPKNIGLFVVYSVILSVLQSLFSLAINSSIPEFVEKNDVSRVNSVIQAIGAAISIVGPVVGAIAYKSVGMRMLFIINGACLILAGLVEVFLIYENIPYDKSCKVKSKYTDDIKITFSYLSENKIIAFFFVFAAVINFIYNPLMFIVLPYINYNLIKVSGFQLSLMQASGAIGVIMAALLLSVKKDIYKSLLSKFILLFKIQAVLIIFWMVPVITGLTEGSKWRFTIVFSIILIIYGALNTAQNIPMITHFQLQIPDELRARIIGVFASALYITSPLGMWIYGILLENVKWTYVTSISGILMLILSFFASRNKYYIEFINQQKVLKEVET